MTQAEVAAMTGDLSANISRWMAAYAEDRRLEEARASWSAPEDAVATLTDLEAFRFRYFEVAAADASIAAGEPYRTPPFQKRWDGLIEETIRTGGRAVILSPVRHGKTDLLTHKVVQLICRNPNIRILWVGLSEKIARQSVELVKEVLESNQRLIFDFCPPGRGFKPETRTGRPWSAERLTVATRTISAKSPTLTAVGRGGKLLSRDADVIVVDDIIDGDSVSESQRDADADWFSTQLMSRKMPQTAVIAIGSRQHPADLWGTLLRSDQWASVVEQAHSDVCSLPPADVEAHVECVLFPELRPYSWLMDTKADFESQGKPWAFDMVYLNRAHSDALTHFTAEMVERCRNRDRKVGDLSWRTPEGVPLKALRLVAGLDPATKGYQASFLWAVDVEHRIRYMVDNCNDLAGGIPGALALMEDWLTAYGVRHWVLEDNATQDTYMQAQQILDFQHENGVRIEPHTTTWATKWDDQSGVTSMANLMRANPPQIDLPYADAASIAKTDRYAKQLLQFTGETTTRRKAKSDLVMAAWFPEAQIQRWRMAHASHVQRGYSGTSYPGRSGTVRSLAPRRKAVA